MSITHAKVSAVADGADTSLVRPSDWNAVHLGHGFGGQVVTAGVGGQYTTIQAAVDSITDSSASKQYVVLVLPGLYTIGANSGDEIKMSGTSGTRDYISLVGLDRNACIISRPASPGVGSPVIEAQESHLTIANLTVTSPVSRLIHHDMGSGAVFTVDNLSLPEGGGGNGLSMGISGAGSVITVTNCYFGSSAVSVHNGGGTSLDYGTIVVNGCTADYYGGVWCGIDMTTGTSSIRAYIAGNAGEYHDVDASHAISLTLTEGAAPRLLLYVAGPGLMFSNPNNVTKFWNRIAWPIAFPVTSSTAFAEGDVLTVTPSLGANFAGSAARTTSADSLFPVVAIEQEDSAGNSGWAPRVASGAFAEVTCETAGAVAVGDILVTGTVSGKAKVNNSQTDQRRILGYAMTTKASSTAGRVVVKLSDVARSW